MSDKKKWALLILHAIGNSENHERYKAKGPRSLTIVRYGKKKCDLDNIAGGAKGMIDELRSHRLLMDDDPSSMVSLTVSNGDLDSKEKPYTLIYLEDITCS